jgi:hypothetical protein
VVDAGVVDEACFCDFSNLVGEYLGVRGNEGFEVAWGGGRASAARVEVFGDDLIDEAGVVLQFCAHLVVGVFAGFGGFFAAFDYEFETLIELVFDLFAVFEVLLRVLLEKL